MQGHFTWHTPLQFRSAALLQQSNARSQKILLSEGDQARHHALLMISKRVSYTLIHSRLQLTAAMPDADDTVCGSGHTHTACVAYGMEKTEDRVSEWMGLAYIMSPGRVEHSGAPRELDSSS